MSTMLWPFSADRLFGKSLSGALAVLLCWASAPGAGAQSSPPGAFDATATSAAVCERGYAHAHRHVPYHLRDIVYDRYGLKRGQRRGYVIDHLVPLELGGTNALANLWPQTRATAHRKDRDEDRLHDEVCAGAITLAGARAEILRLWHS